jgi:hypothetical protein
MLQEERRCCRRRGDVAGGEEMLQEERRCCRRRGDVAGGEEITSEERRGGDHGEKDSVGGGHVRETTHPNEAQR